MMTYYAAAAVEPSFIGPAAAVYNVLVPNFNYIVFMAYVELGCPWKKNKSWDFRVEYFSHWDFRRNG